MKNWEEGRFEFQPSEYWSTPLVSQKEQQQEYANDRNVPVGLIKCLSYTGGDEAGGYQEQMEIKISNNRRRRLGIGRIDEEIKDPEGYINFTRMQGGLEHFQTSIDEVSAKSYDLDEITFTQWMKEVFGEAHGVRQNFISKTSKQLEPWTWGNEILLEDIVGHIMMFMTWTADQPNMREPFPQNSKWWQDNEDELYKPEVIKAIQLEDTPKIMKQKIRTHAFRASVSRHASVSAIVENMMNQNAMYSLKEMDYDPPRANSHFMSVFLHGVVQGAVDHPAVGLSSHP